VTKQVCPPGLIILLLPNISHRSGSVAELKSFGLREKSAERLMSSVADPDPGSGAFFAPGSGIGKKMRIIFPRAEKQFFGLKYLNSLMRIRDPEWKKFGSGIREWKKFGSGIRNGKIRIRDPVLTSRIRNTAIFSGGAAPEAAEEPMETEGGAAVEPAAAAAADLPPPATAAASDPAPPPPGQSPAPALFSVADPDPGPGAFLTPGSGIQNGFFADPGSQTHTFESLVTIFVVKSSIIL
jgi:hypothetical protein